MTFSCSCVWRSGHTRRNNATGNSCVQQCNIQLCCGHTACQSKSDVFLSREIGILSLEQSRYYREGTLAAMACIYNQLVQTKKTSQKNCMCCDSSLGKVLRFLPRPLPGIGGRINFVQSDESFSNARLPQYFVNMVAAHHSLDKQTRLYRYPAIY